MADLQNFHWIATHTDKTVEKPNYVDIDRSTLQSISFYKSDGGEEILTVDKPLIGAFKLALRLKTQGSADQTGVLNPNARFVLVYDGIKYYCINEQYEVTEANKCIDLDFSPFPFAANLGETE